MSTNTQGHNHGGKSHLLGMLGIGVLVFVVLLATGRSFQQALPLAFILACPLMMVGMMFMMRNGNGNQQGNDAAHPQETTERTDATERLVEEARANVVQDSPRTRAPLSIETTTRP